MEKKDISLAPLAKALKSLERSIAQPKDEFSRDSVIQRFEYTFELCWKTLQKVLESDRPLDDPGVRGILRESARQGLISQLDTWFSFQKARNLTSHTYNEDTAEEVYGIALALPALTHELVAKVSARLS